MEVLGDMVKIYGRHRSNVAAGAQALRSFIAVNSRAPGCKMYPLMHRSPTVPDPFIFLQPTEDLGYINFSGAWRGVAMPQHTDTGGTAIIRNDEARMPLSSRDLIKAIEVLGQSIRPVPGQPRMRIHFGLLHATHKKKDVDYFHTTANFAAFLSEVSERGVLRVHHRLGGPDLTLKVREEIYATETKLDVTKQKFRPSSATTLHLRDVKPKYCLVLFSGNRRIELDVLYDSRARPTASAPRIYESHAKFAAAEIAVACPDQKFDWHLVVEGDIAAEEYGTQTVHDMIALARHFEFDQPDEESSEFPSFTVPSAAMNKAKIDKMSCKVTWTFESVKKPLFVEVSVYHDWTKSGRRATKNGRLYFDTAQEPVPIKSCGISLYGVEWDGKMQLIDPASGTFDQDFLQLFSDNAGSSTESVNGLLEEIDYLLDMLSRKAGQV